MTTLPRNTYTTTDKEGDLRELERVMQILTTIDQRFNTKGIYQTGCRTAANATGDAIGAVRRVVTILTVTQDIPAPWEVEGFQE